MATEARVNIRAKAHTKEIARVKKLMTGLRKTVLNLKTASVALGGAAGMGLIVRAGLRQVDVVGKMSRLYRVSTEDIGAMTLASRIGGAELDTFLKASRNVSRQMFDFSRGTGEAKDAMEEMGLTVNDIKPLMNDQVALMGFLAGKVNEVESSVDRLAIAQDIFGGRAAVILNVLEDGTKTVEAFRTEAALLGGALSKDSVQGVEAANDSFTRLGFLLEGLRNQTVASLAPAIESSVDTFKDWILEIADAEGGVERFAQKMAISILRGLRDVIDGFQTFLDNIDAVRESLVSLGVLEEGNSKKEIAAQRIKIKNLNRSIVVYEKFNITSEVYNELLVSREGAYEKLNKLQGGNVSLTDRAKRSIDGLITSIEKRNQVESSGGAGGGLEEVKTLVKVPDNDEQLKQRVVAIRESFLNEEQQLALSYANRAVTVADWAQVDVDRRLEGNELLLALEAEHQEGLTAIHDAEIKKRTDLEARAGQAVNAIRLSVANNAIGLLQALGSKSRVLAIASIALTKGVAIAQTLAQTQTAAVLAYSSQLVPGVPATYATAAKAYTATQALGRTSAALIGLTGLAQAANVGGGGASLGSPANPVNTRSEGQQNDQFPQQIPGQRQFIDVRVTVDGDLSPDQADQLAESLAKNMANGGRSPVAA